VGETHQQPTNQQPKGNQDMTTSNIITPNAGDTIRSWDFGQPLPGEGEHRINYIEGTVVAVENNLIEFVATKSIRSNEDKTAHFVGKTYFVPAQGAMFGEKANADRPRVETIS
jgi:ribosomal protein L19